MTDDELLQWRTERLARADRVVAGALGVVADRWMLVELSEGHRAAIPLAEIESVQALADADEPDPGAPGVVTPLIGAPPHVLGLMPVQGAIVTVLDLARLLDIEPETAPDRSDRYALIVPIHRGRVAVRVRQIESLSKPLPMDEPVAGSNPHVTGIVPGVGPLLALRALIEDPRWVVDLAF